MSIANKVIIMKSRHVKAYDYILIGQMARGGAREKSKSNKKKTQYGKA